MIKANRVGRARTGLLAAGIVTAVAALVAACGGSASQGSGSSSGSGSASASTADTGTGAGGAGGTTSQATGDTSDINLGGLVPLTGGGSAYGESVSAALQVAVDEVNAEPPLGRTIKLHIEDSQTAPDAAVSAAQKLINIDNVSAILGLWSGSVSSAVGPIAEQTQVMTMTSGGNHVDFKPDAPNYNWHFSPPNEYTGAAVAEAALQQGWKSAWVLSRNDDAGKNSSNGFKQYYEANGGKVIDTTLYAPDQSSYTSEVRAAIDSGADVIVSLGYAQDLAALLKDASNAAHKGNWLSIGWAVNSDLFAIVDKASSDGLYSASNAPNVDSDAYKNFQKMYKKATQRDALPADIFAFYAYDEVISVALAMEACGCDRGPELVSAFRDIATAPGTEVTSYAQGIELLRQGAEINYQGISGDLEFDANGYPRTKYGLYQVTDQVPKLVSTFDVTSLE